MERRFEEYQIHTGYTRSGHVPYATIKEFAALVGTGSTHEDALADLKRQFHLRVARMLDAGEQVPAPGSPSERVRFASNKLVEAQRPFIDDFWQDVLGVSYAKSYVSDESTLSAWEHYVGGRDNLIAKVQQLYGVDISPFYDEPVSTLLVKIRCAA